ncbi:hypothetical protein N3K66_003085 [Trichothecium roseum]|uniref:Uncharacterized protein n=1 Tax=Trichothecium roseum TaxID=47278 RepID=A0ACC0V4G8_9HYPO|nr:hypothetical protein N3K66_003085 [Trichothecium roseum]
MPRRRRPPRAGALTELPPLKIAAQIAVLQALYYAVALVLMLFTTLVMGHRFGLDLVLGWDLVRGDTTQGWVVAFVWVLDGGLCMAAAIVALIARSKLVPDFALTMHALHLVFTALYTRSLPRHALWYAAMLASAAVSVALGTWGCRYRELQPVFFGGGRILGNHAAPRTGGDGGGRDEEQGLVEDGGGHGRGRTRSKGEEYEMDQLEGKRSS